MDELSTTIQRRPDRLPTTYRPMADAITGGRRVMLSTDTASRRALRSVGKVAATTDDVIHLDPSATPARRLDEVIAHELTHVAHPSSTPRFFDDIDHSPEERKAEQVAEIIARSPLAPNAPAARQSSAAQASGTKATDTIRRSPSGRSAARQRSSASSAGVSADALAASISSSASRSASLPSSAAMLHRAIDTGSSSASAGGRAAPAAAPAEMIQRREAPDTGAEVATGSSDGGSSENPFESTAAEEFFLDQLDRHFDRIIDRLEARMIVELERRGGRTWGGL